MDHVLNTTFFTVGWVLLFVSGAVAGILLKQDYRSRLRPGIFGIAAAWLFLGIHFALLVSAAIFRSWHLALRTSVAVAGGSVLIAIGSAICLSAVYAYRGSFKRLNGLDTTRLVTDGVYRWSRNPQTIGWTVVLAGVALLRNSGMVLSLAIFFWLAMRLYLPLEEALLQHLYGDEYERYHLRTNRYFGRAKA